MANALKDGQGSEIRPELFLINLCGSQALDRWVGEVVGEADIWTLILSVLPETFSCHHDWDGGLGDKVVGEGAKNDAVLHISGLSKSKIGEIDDLPFERTPPPASQDDQCRRNVVNDFCNQMLRALAMNNFNHDLHLELCLPQ